MLKDLMKDEVGGDPISGVKWTRKSTRALAAEMGRQDHPISRGTVGRLLREMGFSLKANVKNLSGPRHPDREKQFGVIGRKVQHLRREGIPILSVDTKKKEVLANYQNAGRTWRDQPIQVSDHDFPDPELGRAIPFGIYDVVRNQGRVVVGTSVQTASFAVDALAEWYLRDGRRMYPEAREILILCDNGGCNGSTNRLWKYELQLFADQFGLKVHVSHYPPGASKWNPVEHRLFSFISKNWSGQPLTSYEKVINYIRTTRTQTGLRVRANLLVKNYERGIEISDELMNRLNLRGCRVLPDWNYTIRVSTDINPHEVRRQLVLRAGTRFQRALQVFEAQEVPGRDGPPMPERRPFLEDRDGERGPRRDQPAEASRREPRWRRGRLDAGGAQAPGGVDGRLPSLPVPAKG
jgi:hypothetical protein